jgi:hypothetical protein
MNHFGRLQPADDMGVEQHPAPALIDHASREVARETDGCQQVDPDEPIPAEKECAGDKVSEGPALQHQY